MSYSGQMRWRTTTGDEVSAQLGEPLTKDQTAQAWRTALDPAGDWMGAVLAAADSRLTQVRRGMPDAGGLVIATDQASARAYARILEHVSGEKPVVVLSDDDGASQRIESFTDGPAALDGRRPDGVRRASTCPGWRSGSTPRRPVPRCSSPRRSAGSCGPGAEARPPRSSCPACRCCSGLAAELEVERDHALDRLGTRRRGLVPRGRPARGGQPRGEGLGRPGAHHVPGPGRPGPPSTGCCSTSRSSAPRPRSAATRSRTSSASRACSSPTR